MTSLLMAVDLNQDGADELLSAYGDPIGLVYYGQATSGGAIKVNAGHFYGGGRAPREIARFVDRNGASAVVTLLDGSRVMHISDGLTADRRDWLELASAGVRQSRGL